jgi:hypothetical protein
VTTELTGTDANRERQRRLIAEISKAIREEGSTISKWCAKNGLAYPMVSGVINGSRWVGRSDKSVIVALAQALRVPPIQIYFWCGLLDHSDLFTPGDHAIAVSEFDQFVPPNFGDLDASTKAAFRAMYEGLKGKVATPVMIPVGVA